MFHSGSAEDIKNGMYVKIAGGKCVCVCVCVWWEGVINFFVPYLEGGGVEKNIGGF